MLPSPVVWLRHYEIMVQARTQVQSRALPGMLRESALQYNWLAASGGLQCLLQPISPY